MVPGRFRGRRQRSRCSSQLYFTRSRQLQWNFSSWATVVQYQGIGWVIVGGVATRAYMPERVTKDLDILVRRGDEEDVLERLQGAGYHVVSAEAVPGYRLLSPEGVELDLIASEQAWLDEALSRPEIDPPGNPVLGFPYLVLTK